MGSGRQILPALLLAGFVLWLCLGARAAEERKPVEPINIFQGEAPDGTQRIGDKRDLESAKLTAIRSHFVALPTDEWWNGLVPIYGVHRNDRFELRRRPPAGEENLLEPLFFALPGDDEQQTRDIAGSWRCTATRSGSSDAWFVWQLTAEGEIVAGRFDPSSEYRVAYVKGGRYQTNRIELSIEYSNDRYQLTGTLREGRLAGHWTRSDKEESGQWEATRVSLPPHRLPASQPVPLVEWRRQSDASRRYTVGTNSPGPGWSRVGKPLCRVWPSQGAPADFR